ncbi:Smr/MutS family protein [Candidatus Sororendozoicomonas aggregata]|uniref:Smr/MutS family protein n=1 Tax=Candidatus Sororendozoicomonas aggregata TaxID=3073239 RepID=UPI002ED060FA
MSNADNDDDDSSRLFREAMEDVRPLKSTKTHQRSPKERPLPAATYQARRAAAQRAGRTTGGAALSDAWVEPVGPDQWIHFARTGIQHTRLRQLRMGTLPIQFQLDLHGYSIEEARETTAEFLHFCQRQGFVCVRIIHGKAHRSPDRSVTLKSHINHWLKQIPSVLAFCTAPASEGGTGSVLVLIKRR